MAKTEQERIAELEAAIRQIAVLAAMDVDYRWSLKKILKVCKEVV